jgi:SAM-dependent methyltransferase
MPIDAIDTWLRPKSANPPRHLDNIGGGYEAIGKEFLSYFVELGGLQQNDDVLDIGCGLGRMAKVLSGYLDDKGSYEGFDIVPSSIKWCQQNIAIDRSTFHFHLIGIENPYYRQKSGLAADQFEFPWPDQSFDFAFATSVFTHMLPSAVAHYLNEAGRVLRPGGRLFATYSLINDEVEQLSSEGHRQLRKFKMRRPEYWAVSEAAPEALIAFPEKDVREANSRSGLTVDAIYYGSWPGRENFTSTQDIVVSTKTAGATTPGP